VQKLNKTTQDLTSWAQHQQQNEKNIIKADDVDQHARYGRVVGTAADRRELLQFIRELATSR